MNQVYEAIMRHRSVRRFDPTFEVDDETLTSIVRAGQQAATSCSGQMYTVIDIPKDQIDEVFKLCGEQKFVRDASRFLLICVDLHRLKRLVRLAGGEEREWPVTGVLIGVFDAGLMAQNMVLAAESMGLDTCFCGSCGDRPGELVEKLQLPEGVIPLTGLAIGKGLEDPPTRPRLPTDLVFHEGTYRRYTTEDLERGIKTMDDALREEGYYSKYSRRENYGWREHLKNKFGGKWLETVEKRRRRALEKQGLL